ncbi:centrosomal protein of 89 kDa-like isoform X4 [Physella acuta]|uniref:centrosomal protein of 89 kDa-like isoform X4 n=1 Tax=Physella acuta TaxID=109671 RepID=UPI0027DB7493|nr:centrosomal protein of 89 kDa-like isoform X4 [Physella acuta]
MESKMVGKKGKKKSKEVKSAVVPSSAFAAVPTSVTAPAAMAPSTSGKTKQVASPRILGQPSSPVDEFSEPESSLFDYQQMDEAGYMTVGFGTWPTKGKQQRSGMQAQPQFRNSGSTGIYATPGDVEVLAQGDSSHIGNISDLYATPMKKKGKAKRDTSEVDGGTLSRTHQAVETEMKKIYNMTSEPNDTMKEVRAMVHHSHPGSHQTDSGRGSTRPPSRSSHMQTPRSMNRGPGVDGEVHQLRSQNEEMLAELHSLRRVAEAIRDGNVESAQALYLRRQMEDIKEENDTLKSTVHRLNVELSDCLAKYRPVDSAQLKQVIEINGLPSKGPVPSWLINKKYLAPLFLAYDDRLAEKDQVIDECKKELESLKRRAEEILKENQRLRMSGGMGLQANGTEWQQLQEQARLVLEENQVLLEQLQVQTNKSKEMHLSHMAEISRMAKKMALSEGERAEVERQLDEMRVKYREVKHKHDQMVMEVGSQVNVHTHINTIADLKRSVTEEKESFEREMDSLRVKLNASEEERRNQALQMVDLVAENKRLKAEVKAMQKSVKHAQQKMAVLHRAIELSEDKELITQEQLASVIKVAEKTALERDTVYKVAREHQEEAKQTVNRLMQGSVAVGKLEEKLKLYRMKASAKLNTVAERLKEQDEAFNSKKKEYEREIQYLRLLLKEKEEVIESLEKDKKDIEKDLDTMWQAASCENQRVKNILRSGPRKLRDQVHITDALKDEMENEELLHFSEDESSKL